MTDLQTQVVHPSAVRTDWCPVCRAWSLLTADLLLLTPGGVADAGTWAWCEIYDDSPRGLLDGQ